MKKLTLFFTLLSSIVFSQSPYQDFIAALQDQNFEKQDSILKSWEASSPNDAELFTSYFNYYFMLSKQEVLSIDQKPKSNESLSISDSNGTKAFLNGITIYRDSLVQLGMNKIDQGLQLHPDRLDMLFGKIYVYGQTENWKDFTSTIVQAIDSSFNKNHQWLWTMNQPLPDSLNFFMDAIQDYQNQLYQTGNDSLLFNMREIAFKVLEHKPNDIPNLSNASITFMLMDENEKALEYLFKAEKIMPKDQVIIGNIAAAYKKLDNKKKAIKYYEKLIKIGDESTVQFAEEALLELKEKK